LLREVMRDGTRTAAGRVEWSAIRAHAAAAIARLPPRVRGIEAAQPPYRVQISEALRAKHDRLAAAPRT
jgi:nicotinate phosphoribosyltransferase